MIRSIVEQALSIDRWAVDIYGRLRDAEPDRELAAFWGRMAGEEGEHVRYWEVLLSPGHAERLPEVFDDPELVLGELRRLDRRTAELAEQLDRGITRAGAFQIAYRLEFYLLHPSFETLFQDAAAELDIPSPEDEYEAHLDAFVEALRTYGSADPGMVLAGELLHRLWHENRAIALQRRQIRSLRRLLPICASCKKIRDDQGYWKEVEVYFRDHAGADFTHGICPACIRRLYPELTPQPGPIDAG